MARPRSLHMRFAMVALTFLLSTPALIHADTQNTNDLVHALLNLVPDEYYRNNGLTIFPILSLPFGGEEQAMGNAYTAVSRDISFLESNPAAGPLQNNTQLAIHHANIISDVNLESLAFSTRSGDLGFGAFCKLLHTEFTALGITGQQLAGSSYTETVLGINLGYTFFRDYYFTGIGIGANFKLAYRSIPGELYQHVTGLNNTDQSAIGIMGDIGLISRFNLLKGYISRDKNFSLGLTLRNFGPLASNEPLPTVATFGISYQPFRFWLVSADFSQPLNLEDLSLSEHWGYAFGTAVQFVDFFSIKGGFQMKGGNPRFSLGGDIKLTDISFEINYTLDLSTQFKIPDHLSIQAKLELGDDGRANLQKLIDNTYIEALVALSQSEYEKVMRLCEKALSMDPGFSPAKETMDLAQRSLNLVKQIENIRVNNDNDTQNTNKAP